MKRNDYALYKGDKYLYGGSIKDIAKYLNIKERSVRFYTTKAYKERIKNSKERYEIIKVEDYE